MKLYEIDGELIKAIESMFDSVNEETGEIDAGTIERIESLKEERAVKLDGIGAYIKGLSADLAALESEKKNLESRIKTKKAKIESLKNYVSNSMKNAGELKFESKHVVFSFRRSESVNIIDPDKIPKKYLIKKFDVNKSMIKDDLKGNIKVRGAELIENQNLQIK